MKANYTLSIHIKSKEKGYCATDDANALADLLAKGHSIIATVVTENWIDGKEDEKQRTQAFILEPPK